MDVCFDTLDKGRWLRTVCDTYRNRRSMKRCVIHIGDSISNERIMPVHLVLLAYMIDALKKENVEVSMKRNAIEDYIYTGLNFKDYFVKNHTFSPVSDESVFGMWRVNEKEIEVHPRRIQDYLKRVFFQNKDLSAVSISLVEAYYNIFDHSESNDNAWSMMKYDENQERLSVAVCDCGIGIPNSVRQSIPGLSDEDAIRKAMENGFTTGSKTYNKGMGLGFIKDSCTEDDKLRIFSGNGLLVASRDSVKTYRIPFYMQGTLMYYDLTLSHLGEEEIMNDFQF